MKRPARPLLTRLATLLLLASPLSQAASNDTLESREPLIAQCVKDKACRCKDLGGDVYDKGAVVRCVFEGLSVDSTYAYFRKYHTPKLTKLLAEQLPEGDKKVAKKDPDEPKETVTVQYTASGTSGKRKIQLEFTYYGLGYNFTPKGGGTTLDFVYFSYN